MKSTINSVAGKEPKKFPKLMIKKNTGSIFLVYSPTLCFKIYEGNSIHPDGLGSLFGENFIKNYLTDWEGSITLWA